MGFGKVPSLLFDIEMDDAYEPSETTRQEILEGVHCLSRLLEPKSFYEEQLVDDVDYVISVNGTCAEDVAEGLHHLHYDVRVRRGTGVATHGTECLQNLRHTFIVCSLPGVQAGFIVDPRFRDQFIIANPTPAYSALMDNLPQVFVGTEAGVQSVVQFLCGEMCKAFCQQGVHVPPWRRASAMLSKWQPRKSEETVVGSPNNTPTHIFASQNPFSQAGHPFQPFMPASTDCPAAFACKPSIKSKQPSFCNLHAARSIAVRRSQLTNGLRAASQESTGSNHADAEDWACGNSCCNRDGVSSHHSSACAQKSLNLSCRTPISDMLEMVHRAPMACFVELPTAS